MIKSEMKRTGLYVRPEIYDRIKDYCDYYGISVNAGIQMMCVDFLDRKKSEEMARTLPDAMTYLKKLADGAEYEGKEKDVETLNSLIDMFDAG